MTGPIGTPPRGGPGAAGVGAGTSSAHHPTAGPAHSVTGRGTSGHDQALERELQGAARFIERILNEVNVLVVGQETLRRRLVNALLAGGHVLLEGVPGLGKTLSIKTLARCIDARFQRIQFTPDLLPGDVVGTEVFRPQDGAFEIRRGPVFANFLLADEINRAPAKVQSALLETMEERQVTIGRETIPLPTPFFVMATQNPIEQEGTYPLPEAQVDRFLMKIKVDYPSPDEEKKMLDLIMRLSAQGSIHAGGGKSAPVGGSEHGEPTQEFAEHAAKEPVRIVATLDDILALQRLCSRIYVDERVRAYIVSLVNASRTPSKFGLKMDGLIELGASPRGVISLLLCARAEALMNGEHYVAPHTVKSVAADVLRHRIIPSYEAEAQGLSSDALVAMILDGVDVP